MEGTTMCEDELGVERALRRVATAVEAAAAGDDHRAGLEIEADLDALLACAGEAGDWDSCRPVDRARRRAALRALVQWATHFAHLVPEAFEKRLCDSMRANHPAALDYFQVLAELLAPAVDNNEREVKTTLHNRTSFTCALLQHLLGAVTHSEEPGVSVYERTKDQCALHVKRILERAASRPVLHFDFQMRGVLVSSLLSLPDRVAAAFGTAVAPSASIFSPEVFQSVLVRASHALVTSSEREADCELAGELLGRMCMRGKTKLVLTTWCDNRCRFSRNKPGHFYILTRDILAPFLRTPTLGESGRFAAEQVLRTALDVFPFDENKCAQILSALMPCSDGNDAEDGFFRDIAHRVVCSLPLTGAIIADSALRVLVSTIAGTRTNAGSCDGNPAKKLRSDVMMRAIDRAMSMWSSDKFLQSSDIARHRQITLFLLLCMEVTGDSDALYQSERASSLHSDDNSFRARFLQKLLHGIRLHLGLTDDRPRAFGMLMAERTSTWWCAFSSVSEESDKTHLRFDLPPMLAEDDALLYLVRPESSQFLSGAMRQVGTNDTHTFDAKVSGDVRPDESNGESGSSDTDSLPPYDMSDDELGAFCEINAIESGASEKQTTSAAAVSLSAGGADVITNTGGADANALRKSIGSVFSLPRLLHLLRKFARGEDDATAEAANSPAVLLAALANIQKSANPLKPLPGIEAYAEALVQTLMQLEPGRFPPDTEKQVASLRSSALAALSELQPGTIACALARDFVYSKHCVMSLRREALSIIASTARATSTSVRSQSAPHVSHNELQNKTFPQTRDLAAADAGAAADAKSSAVGTVTRKLEKSLEIRRREREHAMSRYDDNRGCANRFALVAGPAFRALGCGLGQKSAALDLDGEDAALHGHIIATLAVILSCAGPSSLDLHMMCSTLLHICLLRARHPQLLVRRAVAIALGSVARALPEELLASSSTLTSVRAHHDTADANLILAASRALEWLDAAVRDDPDELVRKLSAASAIQWAGKLRRLSENPVVPDS